ncbi:unnamed protein product [Dovyalis caffra]|uniref:Uncharacterized protein n=1 Tax=Dovyalis caffra TaxID=77055 RepID=A0AAV1QZ97_9ROSI|nr:unnamed protein product [Dovyalis caffra]
MFDRTHFSYWNLSLPKRKCRYDIGEEVYKIDCTAHFIEYDVLTNYPSTGSAVLLPLMLQAGTNNIVAVEVLVYRGAPKGSFMQAKIGRVMNGMILLLNSNVLIINSAKAGTTGGKMGEIQPRSLSNTNLTTQ